MAVSDSTTVDFPAAAAAFTDASGRVYAIHLGAHQLAVDLEVAEGSLDSFRHHVTNTVAGQNEPGPLTERVIAVLAADPQYLALMTKAQEIRTQIAQNEAELERARDERSLAGRRMDYAVASRAAGEDSRDDG